MSVGIALENVMDRETLDTKRHGSLKHVYNHRNSLKHMLWSNSSMQVDTNTAPDRIDIRTTR